MNFSDIVGQSPLVDRLKSILAGGRIVHSYVFTAPPGAGKKTIADIFARALVCDSKGDKPCDVCHSCHQYFTGNHPDVHRVATEKKSIGVDIIREMQADIKVKPFQGERKVYIIDQAHTMTVQAQNALLKTLEEPPGYTVLLLLADNPTSLLPTVLSRCQILRIPKVSTANVCRIIERRMGMPGEKAMVFARLSEGLPGKGLELAASDEYQELREGALELLAGMPEWTPLSAIGHVDFFADKKDRIDAILDLLVLFLRDIIIYRETGDSSLVVNLDKISLLKSIANGFTTEAIQCMINNVERTRKMLKSNANYQLAVENMLLALQGLQGDD